MDSRLKEALRRADLAEEVRMEEIMEWIWLRKMKADMYFNIRNKNVRMALIRRAAKRVQK